MNKLIVLGLVRDILKVVGAGFATDGIASGDEVNTIAGGIAALVGVVWSIFDKNKKV